MEMGLKSVRKVLQQRVMPQAPKPPSSLATSRGADLAHFDAGREFALQAFDQHAGVDFLLGAKEKGDDAAVIVVFGGDEFGFGHAAEVRRGIATGLQGVGLLGFPVLPQHEIARGGWAQDAAQLSIGVWRGEAHHLAHLGGGRGGYRR